MFQGNSVAAQGPQFSAGFTMVELMVVLAVAAILLAIAVPGLQDLVKANQLTAVTDTIATALNEARSEAARSGTPSSLTNPTAGGVDWGSQGWTVVSGPVATGTTLRRGTPAPAGITVFSTAASPAPVTFDPTGRLASPGPVEFLVCQKQGPANGGTSQMIMVALSGSVRVAQNDASGFPLDTTGAQVKTCTPP